MLSAGGLVAYGLTITFASFDWVMSLDPHWFSTIYGVLFMGGQGLTALAFLIIALAWLSRREPLNTIVVPAHFHDLGNLMLAFVMLWAYFSFSQYLIIYSGNLPEEITWYTRRLFTGWRVIGIGLVVFHFARAVPDPAVARGQAQSAAAGEGGDRRDRRPAHRPVLADRARAAPRRLRPSAGSTCCCRSRSAACGSAASSGSCAAVRCCRSTIRSSTRRSGRSSTRRRSARYERARAITWSRSTSRRSITKRPTSTSARFSGSAARCSWSRS